MSQDEAEESQERRDFFISYTGSDRQWAEWIAWQLEEAGYTLFLQAWDFLPGSNFVAEMDRAAKCAERTLLMLSPAYLLSDYTFAEWAAAFRYDPKGTHRRLLPVRIQPCEVDGLLGPVVYIDLVQLEEEQARERLLAGIQQGRAKPATVAFPGQTIPHESPVLVAFPGSVPILWNIPFARNPFFTGREKLLEQLHTQLQTMQTAALSHPQAISGLGGIGKTQIAVEYAYRFHQHYQVVLWTRAETHESLISGYVALARVLHLPEKDEQDQPNTVQAVMRWLTTHTQWLLILDNTDDLSVVREFLPPTFGGHILLTTRAQAMGRLAQRIEVDIMEKDVGTLLLLRRASLIAPDAPLEHALVSNVATARDICEELGGLPLALDQAGAYIEETMCSLLDYQSLYRARRAELLKERGGLVDDHPESVATTWSLSFQKVEQKDPPAAELLRCCAFLHPDAIPEEIITAGAEYLGPLLQTVARDPLALNKAIATLRAYSLIRRDATNKTLSVHRLVQAVLKDVMDASTYQMWVNRVVHAVETVLPEKDYHTTGGFERFLAHAQSCAGLIEQCHLTSRAATQLLYRTGVYLAKHARYAEAEALYVQCLHIRERVLGSEHPEVAYPLYVLAELYREQGKYSEAAPLYQRTLHIWRQTLGPEYPELAYPLRCLAELYHMQGKYNEAEPLYQQALHIGEQVLGPEHHQIADLLNCLANLYREQGKYSEAESLYQRALRIDEQTISSEHLAGASTLHGLAELYNDQGRYGEAELLYQRALHIYEQVLDPEHPRIAPLLHNLANLYLEEGKQNEAELLYQRALRIEEQAFGPEHHQLAHSLNSLANIYLEQGKYSEAESLYLRAVRIYVQAVGPPNVQLASPLNNLGKLYQAQGKYGEAESLCQQALHIREQALGPEHREVATSLHTIAELYRKQGKYSEAESLYQRALRIREKALGPEHPDLTTPLNGLANLYCEQGKYAAAEPLYQRALSLWDQKQDATHPRLASLLQSMGKHYYEQGKYAAAEPLAQRALRIREQTLGAEHPELASLLNDLAILYREQGKYAEAESLFLRTLHIQEQASGLEHPDVAIQLDGLANLYADQNKYEEAEPLYQQAIHIQEQAVGSEHPDVAASLNNLAELYREQGKYEEAEPLYLRAIRIWELSLGPEHLYTAQGLNNLALIYSVPGKYGEAERLHQRALHIREQALGPEHPEVATSLNNLAVLYSVQGKYTEAESLLVDALEIVERKLGPHHPQTSAFHRFYRLILREMGREAEAIQEEARGQGIGMTRNQKRGKTQPLSHKQEHDLQYNLVHKCLSNLVERASENIKEMCSLVLHEWEEAVLEESKTGEAFALYGLPPKTVSQLVPQNRTHEGRNPRPSTGEESEQVKGSLYVIDVDQNPFEVALDDEFYSLPLPLNMALRQAFDITHQRFFTKDGDMKQPNNPECRRIYQGIVSATHALHMRRETE